MQTINHETKTRPVFSVRRFHNGKWWLTWRYAATQEEAEKQCAPLVVE